MEVPVMTQGVQQIAPGAHPVMEQVLERGKQEENPARAVAMPSPSGTPWSLFQAESSCPKA